MTTDLTREALLRAWRQNTTNDKLRKSVLESGPRAAFGEFREFILEVRNDIRPDTTELLSTWGVSAASFDAACSYNDIRLGSPSDRLRSWIKQARANGMSIDRCAQNFKIGTLCVKQILNETKRQPIACSVEYLQEQWLQKRSLRQVAALQQSSVSRLKRYLTEHQLVYGIDLFKETITSLVRSGVRESEIAALLDITYATVRNHIRLWGIEYSEVHLRQFRARDSESRKQGGVLGAAVVKQQSTSRLVEQSSSVHSLHHDGLSVRRISQITNLSEGTVKKTLIHCGVTPVTKKEHMTSLSKASYDFWMNNPREGFDYSLVTLDEWQSEDGKIPVMCPTHGVFYQNRFNHFSLETGCPKCTGNKPSRPESEVASFIESLGLHILRSDRTVLKTKELDILVPSHNLAVEFNGLYWHSSDADDSRVRTRHINKTTECEANGIQLLHINSNEWSHPLKQDIWKSMIAVKLGLATFRIAARKTSVVEIRHDYAVTFLEENHIQGFVRGTHLGLVHQGRVVSVLTYGASRFEKNKIEVLRFCTCKNTIVVGGLSKLITEVQRRTQGVLVSYANRRWSKGEAYTSCGFANTGTTPPSYWYIKSGTEVLSRYQCQKHKLSNFLPAFDPSKSEKQNMLESGYRIMYDCGHLKFEKII